MPIRVVIADDHSIYREALCRMLKCYPCISVMGEAASGAEAIRLVQQLHPDVAVLDVRMKDMNGLDAIPVMRDRSRSTSVLMLSVYDDKQYVERAVRAGARGYLLKDAAIDTLVDAIRMLHAGQFYFSPSVSDFARQALREQASPPH